MRFGLCLGKQQKRITMDLGLHAKNAKGCKDLNCESHAESCFPDDYPAPSVHVPPRKIASTKKPFVPANIQKMDVFVNRSSTKAIEKDDIN